MSIYKIKNVEFAPLRKNYLNTLKRDEKIYTERKSNSISLDKRKELIINGNKKVLNKILSDHFNKIYQINRLRKKNISRKDNNNKNFKTRNNLIISNTNVAPFISLKEKDNVFNTFRLIKHSNIFQKMNDKYIEIKSNSYINNSTISQKTSNKISRSKEKKIPNLKINKTFMNKYENIANNKKYFNRIFKYQELYDKKFDQTRIKSPIREIEIDNEDLNNKTNKDRFSKIFNKYISKNIINGLSSYNRIKNLIKRRGFDLEKYDFNSIYKDDNNYYCNNENRTNFLKRPYNNDKIIKNESIYKYFSLIKNKNTLNSSNIIKKKQKLYLSPVNNDNNYKSICNQLKDLNINNSYKGYISYIINEVNKYYKNNNFSSAEEFYKEWTKENQRYITINDMHHYLNNNIKLNKEITKENIMKLLFDNFQLKYLSYDNFKKIFFGKQNEKENGIGKQKDNKISKNYKKNIIELIKNNKYNEIIQRIIEIKEILIAGVKYNNLNELNEQENYMLSFDQFYKLLKKYLLRESEQYLKDTINIMYLKFYDKDKNKIDFFNFLDKIEKSNNNRFKNKTNINENIINNLQKVKEEDKNNLNNENKKEESEKKKRNLSYNNTNEELTENNNEELKKISNIQVNRRKKNVINKDNEFPSQKSEITNVSIYVPKKKEKNLDIINFL